MPTSQLRLLFIVNVDWFFVSHRLPIAMEAIRRGYEVHVATGVTDRREQLEALGIRVHPLTLTRSGTLVRNEVRAVAHLLKLLREIRPDVVHLVTIKPVIYGGLAARLARTPRVVASISGLGYLFIDPTRRARSLQRVARTLYRAALRSPKVTVIFQNVDDRRLFVELGIIAPAQAELIRGSGVDLLGYPVQPEPSGRPVVMFLARLLKDKGVREFIEAARILGSREDDPRFVLVGDVDVGNPNSVTQDEVDAWAAQGIVEFWGYSSQVAQTLAESTLVVLPSYREGLPKSLIEAAACGRAVVTTDVPGCRDAIEPGATGVLVPARDAPALAAGIALLLDDPALRASMATRGRALAKAHFDVHDVVERHMQIYGKGP